MKLCNYCGINFKDELNPTTCPGCGYNFDAPPVPVKTEPVTEEKDENENNTNNNGSE